MAILKDFDKKNEVYPIVEAEQVNHPSHHSKSGRKECIVEMEEYSPVVAAMYCLTSAYKYLYRAGEKFGNPARQEIEKAKWCLDYTDKLIKEHKHLLSFNGMRIEHTDFYLDIKRCWKMFHKFKVEPCDNSKIHAMVSIDDKPIRCCGYSINHIVDEVPTVELELCCIPNYEHDAVIHISNKEEIARLMDETEFKEFCKIWNEVHNE